MIHCEFTSFRTLRGPVLSGVATALTIVLMASLSGCQDIPIARQRLAELVAPRDAGAAAAIPASGNASIQPKVASGVAASFPRSGRSGNPRDRGTPYQVKPGDMGGYSLHM
ncbi:hypothetical protein [Burkholderia vietnamiensis]|uniref:hypothetical protein n=1 Tax=Burkholderia vietnamiensis TaxID=60552 RepID=UPI001B9978CD|nr:hypothetical protein [Burkholderia vietnamiensis]MBR8034633.1 hypothetical protein [Burkholderia vietnamiensis]